MMLVWAPMGALADSGNSNAPTEAPGNSANAPGQADGTAPGNSENAPGQATTDATVVASDPAPAPGNSGSAPGQTKTDSGPPPSSNAGGNSGGSDSSTSTGGGNPNAGGGNPNAGGGNPNAGGGNPNAGGGNPNSGDSGSNNGDPAHEGDCDQNDDGTGGVYDANCDGTHQNPGPGNSDNSPGKPADGTVGKADNKNPKGQQPGGNDHNKGYECEPGNTNKGVGKGNPAHTGCTYTPPPCATSAGTSLWALTVSATNASSVTHSSDTYTQLPTNFTITATAATGYNTTGIAGGSTTATYTTTFSNTDCAEDFTVAFRRISRPCPPGTDHEGLEVTPCDDTDPCPPGTDRAGQFVTPCDVDDPCPPGTDRAGQFVTPCDVDDPCPPGTDRAGQFVTPCDVDDPCPPGTDRAGQFVTDCDLDDPCPPGTDHAGEFVTVCDDDDVLGNTLCPDGTVMPASGECNESVLPDFVLGIRLNQDPVAPAVLPNTLHAAPEGVAGAVLPFTGGSLLPFVMVSLATLSVGAASLIRRKK